MNPDEIIETLLTNPDLKVFTTPILYGILGIWIFTTLFLIVDALRSFRHKILGLVLAIVSGVIIIPGVFIYFLLKPDREVEAHPSVVQKCEKCGVHHTEPVKYCYQCGNQLLKECESCNFFQPFGYRFCINCGEGFKSELGVHKLSKGWKRKVATHTVPTIEITDEDRSFIPIVHKFIPGNLTGVKNG